VQANILTRFPNITPKTFVAQSIFNAVYEGMEQD
jgi:hypothetical protein